MGKYIKKTKATGEIAVMEVSQSTFGVRTRAKTLALQRLQNSSTLASASPPSSGSYLQLRSRRLEKPPIFVSSHELKRQKQTRKNGCTRNPRARTNHRTTSKFKRLRVSPVPTGSNRSASVGGRVNSQNEQEVEAAPKEAEIHDKESKKNDIALGAQEASFGENDLDFDGRERDTRESTPCSLIRDPDTIRTPSSTTRPTSLTDTICRVQNSSRRHIPTTREMDQFFTGAEEEQQKQFIEKYNFDPVKDKPLPGRYQWEKLHP